MATCPHCGGPAYSDDPCDCNAARLETLLADNQEATHEVAAWRNRYEDLKAALRDKDTALAESEALVMNHEGHIARLEDEIEKLQGRLDDSEAENGNLGEECGHLEEELERLKLYESEHERLKGELNRVLHPAGDGPKSPSFCDLVAYVESDFRKLRECKAEVKRLRERLQFDPGGSDKIDELEQALDMTKATLAAAREENERLWSEREELTEASAAWLTEKLGDEQYARLVSSFRTQQDDASKVCADCSHDYPGKCTPGWREDGKGGCANRATLRNHDAGPPCPQCHGPLVEIKYPGGYLNRDQWESQIAGNWLCEKCPDNGRANNKKCYWWNREVFVITAEGREP